MFGIKKREKFKKVLLVEDDALLAGILMNSLSSEKFEAVNIKDGLQALEAAKKFQPDVVLLDLILPGLDGFEVLRQLKSENKLKKIPVFIISNLDSISDVKSAKALGAEDYFIKANTDIEKIIKVIKKITNQ